MAKYEFRFIVTDVDLSQEVQENVSRAVAQAGALALAEHTPADAVTIPLSDRVLWRGIPPEVEFAGLQGAVAQKVQFEAGGSGGER